MEGKEGAIMAVKSWTVSMSRRMIGWMGGHIYVRRTILMTSSQRTQHNKTPQHNTTQHHTTHHNTPQHTTTGPNRTEQIRLD